MRDKVKLEDLHGQGIDRAMLYLTKIADFNWDQVNGSWAYLKLVQKLRNALAHKGGHLKDSDKKLLNFIEKSNHLKIEIIRNANSPDLCDEKRIVISSGFINELIEKMELFFKNLDGEVLAFANKT